MQDLFERSENETEIVRGRKLAATVTTALAALQNDFVTKSVEALELTFEGIRDDFHAGNTRLTGSREPWYPRKTEIRNERQLSIVASDELADVARKMGITELKPEWIGANLVIDGVARLSMLPAGTMMFFKNGVTLKVDAQNIPCRYAGRSIARHAKMPDEDAGSLLFPKHARRQRGLVAWVEKPGTITAGEEVSIRVPEQWIYR